MDPKEGETAAEFTNPLAGVTLGDPFVLAHRGWFYLFGTNDGPPLADGRAVPVFRSGDLIHWEPLGGALVPRDPSADHWAPEVLAWNGRFYMVVSYGDVERRGHELWVAVADRPEGPYSLRSRVSDPSERFSIDGSWLLDDDGRLYLFRCLDFVEEDDPPHGTGIVVQPMRDPLTPSGPPQTVLRAHSPWHLFEADRRMPLYGGRVFPAWTTIEGPAPLRRCGRYYCGYSGGNFTGDYGTGEAVAVAPLGPYDDLRGREGPLFGTIRGLVEGPGHYSVIRPDLIHDWIVLHGRRPGEPGRRVWLCPASWTEQGVTVGPLTDRPQPAPPRPAHLHRFDGADGPAPAGWRVEAGEWRLEGAALRQCQPDAVGLAWSETIELSGEWALELYVRTGAESRCEAGVRVGNPREAVEVRLRNGPQPGLVIVDREGRESFQQAPTLGEDPFDLEAFHAILVTTVNGLAEIRLDGVVMASHVPLPVSASFLALLAKGPAAFDAVRVALLPQSS